jgi:Fe-S cluster assembly iron-binding protein IscA
MLQITDTAEGAIKRIRQENDVPETAALRIAPVPAPDGSVGVGFTFTESPEEGDQTIADRDDFRVYLASELAGPFDDAELNATIAEDSIELELRTQGGLEAPGHNHDGHDHGSHEGHNHP